MVGGDEENRIGELQGEVKGNGGEVGNVGSHSQNKGLSKKPNTVGLFHKSTYEININGINKQQERQSPTRHLSLSN